MNTNNDIFSISKSPIPKYFCERTLFCLLTFSSCMTTSLLVLAFYQIKPILNSINNLEDILDDIDIDELNQAIREGMALITKICSYIEC